MESGITMKRLFAFSIIGLFLVSSNLKAEHSSGSLPASKKEVNSQLDSVISKIKSLTKDKESVSIPLREYGSAAGYKEAMGSFSKTEMASLEDYLSFSKQALGALANCKSKNDPFVQPLKEVLWACTYKINELSITGSKVFFDYPFYEMCFNGLKDLLNKKSEASKVELSEAETKVLASLETFNKKLFDVFSEQEKQPSFIKMVIEENVQKDKQTAASDLIATFGKIKANADAKFCKLEIVQDKRGSERIVDEDVKNKLEKKESKKEDEKDLDPGELKPIPAGGLTDKIGGDKPVPSPTPAPIPSPTGVAPVPVPANPILDPGLDNTAAFPFDLFNSLGNIAQPQIPNIRSGGDRDVRQGDRSVTPPPAETPIPTPTPEENATPTPAPTPSATSPVISLPGTGNTSSGAISGLENLGKNLGVPVTPSPTPDMAALKRSAELAGQKKRDELIMELRMLGVAPPGSAPVSAGARPVNRGTLRPNSLLNRGTKTQSLSTNPNDEVRGDLGRNNTGSGR